MIIFRDCSLFVDRFSILCQKKRSENFVIRTTIILENSVLQNGFKLNVPFIASPNPNRDKRVLVAMSKISHRGANWHPVRQ
jgi:hypothetical protein